MTEEINFGGMEGLEGEGCSPHCAPSRRPLSAPSAAAFPTKGRARTRVGKAFRLRLAFQNVSCDVHAPKIATKEHAEQHRCSSVSWMHEHIDP